MKSQTEASTPYHTMLPPSLLSYCSYLFPAHPYSPSLPIPCSLPSSLLSYSMLRLCLQYAPSISFFIVFTLNSFPYPYQPVLANTSLFPILTTSASLQVSMGSSVNDKKSYVISGQWDPCDPVFAVLNQETPKDRRVFMTVAIDLVIRK